MHTHTCAGDREDEGSEAVTGRLSVLSGVSDPAVQGGCPTGDWSPQERQRHDSRGQSGGRHHRPSTGCPLLHRWTDPGGGRQ